MGRVSRRLKAWMEEYAYLVTLGCVLAIVVGSAIYTRQMQGKQDAGIQAAAQAPEVQETTTPAPQITPLPTIAPLTVRPVTLEIGAEGTWPVEGKVVRAFDTSEMVLWEALGSWRVHAGLDIAGKADEAVRCCKDGVVAETCWDELWGWRIAVDQLDGRRAVYAGLQNSTVSAGESVVSGQTLGLLMESIPCEAEMEAHLHMEVYKNGVAQDPEATLPQR